MRQARHSFLLFLLLGFFSQTLFSSENIAEKLYFETVSKLFKSPISEKPCKISNEIKNEYIEKIKPLLVECRDLQRWSLQKSTINLLQEKEISEKERQAFEKVQKYSVRIYGRVLNVLEKIDCFIPVSQETYGRFSTVQWSLKNVKKSSKVLSEASHNGMKFYHIRNKYYMVLYQNNIDMCDRFLEAVYGQKFDGLGKEESKYVENSFIFIQKEVADIMELMGSDKKLVISEDTIFDLSTIQELLK